MRLDALVGGAAQVVGPETPLDEVAVVMVDADADAVAVVDRSGLAGIFTARDLLKAAAEGVDFSEEPVSEWMTAHPDTVGPDVEVAEAAAWLIETGYRHLPVMDRDELLGIVGVQDLLWALSQG